eukprot:scaffold2015_cov125-Skeletonema_dohrnii-CCMP3373.AAC.10
MHASSFVKRKALMQCIDDDGREEKWSAHKIIFTYPTSKDSNADHYELIAVIVAIGSACACFVDGLIV